MKRREVGRKARAAVAGGRGAGGWGLPLSHREPSVPLSQGLRSPGPPPCSFPEFGSAFCGRHSRLAAPTPGSGTWPRTSHRGAPPGVTVPESAPGKSAVQCVRSWEGLGVLSGCPGGLLRGGGQGLRPERQEEPAGRDPGSFRTLQEGGHWPQPGLGWLSSTAHCPEGLSPRLGSLSAGRPSPVHGAERPALHSPLPAGVTAA